MKRILLISIISLLFVSGWSHVLAAAICPKTQAMTSCPMQMGNKPASSHEMMEMGEMQMTQTVTNGEVNALEQPMASCPHCFSRSEFPTPVIVAVKGVEQSKRDLSAILQQAIKVITARASLFAPPVLSRQHAPPQTSTARHVLINVFLI